MKLISAELAKNNVELGPSPLEPLIFRHMNSSCVKRKLQLSDRKVFPATSNLK